jgi:hypothetical protein
MGWLKTFIDSEPTKQIEDYFEDLVEDFPNLASIEEYGTTQEGRHVKAFVIRKGAPKQTIVVEAALRPR